MNSQLKWKFIFIVLVILFCVFGVVGLPSFPTSRAQLKDNLADRIKLGLDLKGGSHLVLQVQVDEAIGQRCDQTVDQLNKQLHEKNIIVGEIRRSSDTQILVLNVDPATSGAFRDLVTNQFPDWSMAPAAGQVNGYQLDMKPSVLAALRHDTMDQSLETITRRINALGLTEPTIAFTGRGDNEILVQLPHAQILGVEQEQVDVLAFENGLWNRISGQDLQSELSVLPQLAWKKAVERGLPAEAERTLQRQLDERLHTPQPLRLSFKDATANKGK